MKRKTLFIILSLAILGAIVLVVLLLIDLKTDKGTAMELDSETQEQIDELFESHDNCLNDVYNCDDFTTQQDAQDIFELCGGTSNDVHRLDSDNDGVVCEGLL